MKLAELQAKYDALLKTHNTLLKEVEYAIGLPQQNHELNRLVKHYNSLIKTADLLSRRQHD